MNPVRWPQTRQRSGILQGMKGELGVRKIEEKTKKRTQGHPLSCSSCWCEGGATDGDDYSSLWCRGTGNWRFAKSRPGLEDDLAQQALVGGVDQKALSWGLIIPVLDPFDVLATSSMPLFKRDVIIPKLHHINRIIRGLGVGGNGHDESIFSTLTYHVDY